MGVVRTKLYVDGMTCTTCEERIKKTMTSLEGISDVTVRLKGGTVEFSYDDQRIDVQSAKNVIEKIGYAIRETKHAGSSSAIGIGILLAAAYLLVSSSGLFQALPKIGSSISGRETVASNPVATIADGIQTITTEFKDGYYVPFTVQAGVPLKWVIRVTEEDLNGCNNPVEVPEYRIREILVPGDNVIEFTPAKEGTLRYSCWMGMITSKITVVKDIGKHMQFAKKGDTIWKPQRN